eukprot:TRINITY_DN19202_c0_g1_i1.p2 TRINITY_DN19202_c0_g1~~TRINITY_DN19202_c0_g1_i1.p2  ORF type:complete len:144 (+),score=33.32 TRINITY_DN19202_c0_g1_i1:53-484(+)
MKTKFDSDSSAMERKHKDEMVALRTKLDAESAARNEAESAKDALSQELDTLRISNVQSDKKDEALQEMQARMRQTHEAEMSKTKARHQEELAKMTAGHQEEVRRRAEGYEDKIRLGFLCHGAETQGRDGRPPDQARRRICGQE